MRLGFADHTLNQMFASYVACALWSSIDGLCEPLDQNYSEDDFHATAWNQMKADVDYFYHAHEEMLHEHPSQAGHDFWLTRNGHGAGFWDREETWGENADILADAARATGECNIVVGDDGKLYLE